MKSKEKDELEKKKFELERLKILLDHWHSVENKNIKYLSFLFVGIAFPVFYQFRNNKFIFFMLAGIIVIMVIISQNVLWKVNREISEIKQKIEKLKLTH